MKDQIKVVVNSEEGVVSEVLLVNGETAALQVQENVSYEFQSVTEGVAPDELLVKRNGDNLEVYADASSATPLVTIEGYYLLAAPVPLVGMAENGEYFSFVPQTGVAAELPWNLADGASSYQGLGYGAVGSPVPWWPILLAGVLLLGGAAVAASSSSSSSKGAAIIDPTDEDSVFATAQDKVDDAKAAVAAAEQELADAIADGKVTADEVADLNAAIQDAQDKLDDAQGAVDALPAGTAKDDIQTELDTEQGKLNDIVVPPANEAAFTDAQGKVDDAKAAVAAAEQELADAIADGKVTADEVADLNAAIQDAQDKLDDAQGAVDALPAGTAKDDLVAELDIEQDRLDAIVVPTVDSNTFDDAADLLAAAKAAVDAAEQKLADAITDGKVEQSEVDALIAAKDAAQTELDAAASAINALPVGTAKDDLVAELGTEQDRLDAIVAPAANEAAFTDAQGKVNDAKAAVAAAEQELADAIDDGKVTADEVADLNAAIQDAQDKLDIAQDAVDALPGGTAKDDIQTELNTEQGKLNDIAVPVVDEGAFDTAADLLADAKAAVDAAEQKLANAIADGKVEQAEIDALNDAITDAQGKLDTADAAIDALPAGTAKDDLVDELGTEQDRLDAIVVPTVDSNTFDDAADLLADAKAAVDAAEQKLADAIADGKVEQAEIDALNNAIIAAQGTPHTADAAIDALPAGAAKNDLVAELGTEQDRLDAIVVPAVDSNTFDDAADLLADAKAAVDAAVQAKADAIADGKVEQAEIDALTDAIADAQLELNAAASAINALPVGTAKDNLVAELGTEQDRLDAIVAPVSNEAAFTDAQDKVDDAKAAVAAAEQELADAIADGKVTADEVADLNAAIQDAQDKLDDAQGAVDALPAGTAKDDIQTELDTEQGKLNDIAVPVVDEGAFDTAADLLADAKAAVAAAEQELADAIADGKVEQAEIDALNDAITDAQLELDAADAAIDALPAGSAKNDLVAELGTEQDRLDAIVVPTVDSNTFDDAADLLADAKDAVDAAVQAKAAAIADG